jgi:hypothetical protein
MLRKFTLVVAFLFVTAFTGEWDDHQTDLPSNEPYSRMSMRLVKSLFFVRVDVLDLEVHFGLETTRRLESIVTGKDLTAPLESSIADIATQSKDAYIRLRFLRNIDLDRFIKGARENTKKVYEAKLIERNTYEEIVRELPVWYSKLQGRGIKKDDLMLYRVKGNGLRTIYRGNDGQVYFDQEGQGEERRLAVLGSYFAPRSDFRENLIRSLFSSNINSAGGPSR